MRKAMSLGVAAVPVKSDSGRSLMRSLKPFLARGDRSVSGRSAIRHGAVSFLAVARTYEPVHQAVLGDVRGVTTIGRSYFWAQQQNWHRS
jgi:hypothetical protein